MPATLVAGGVSAVAAALQTRGFDLVTALKEDNPHAIGPGARRRRLTQVLILFETAASAVLAVAVVLLVGSVLRLEDVNPGFDARQVLTAWVLLPDARYPEADRRQRFFGELFETKAADVIGLYVNPPRHAAVFALDEKSAIQALDRLQPVLPLSPGRAERHGFEYHRHGTLSLLAALNTQTGEVLGQTALRHTSEVFVEFLHDVVDTHPRGTEMHLIVDNLSIHRTRRVAQFLADHPTVHLHFTPTYSSWLNEIEIWFSKIERDPIARGIFSSVADLRRKIMRYIRHYNRAPKPVRRTYRTPSHRITIDSPVTVH